MIRAARDHACLKMLVFLHSTSGMRKLPIINTGEVPFVFRLTAEGTHTASSSLLLLRAKLAPEKQDAICRCDELTLAGLLALFFTHTKVSARHYR